MPCYDHRDSSEYIRENEVGPLKKRLDTYAGWLCWLLRDRMYQLQNQGAAPSDLPLDLSKWAGEHRAFDARRGA